MLPGSACGMPYAPDGLAASVRQPLSLFHRLTRQENWSLPQPRADTMSAAICWAVPEDTGAL